MRALLACVTLLSLAACGDDPRPGGTMIVNGRKIDVGAMQAAAERARELAERTLTSADVERFIALMPEMKRLETKQEDWAKVLEAHGVEITEWSVLTGRVMSAFYVAKKAPASANEKVKVEAEVVRPYMDRIEAAMKAK